MGGKSSSSKQVISEDHEGNEVYDPLDRTVASPCSVFLITALLPLQLLCCSRLCHVIIVG